MGTVIAQTAFEDYDRFFETFSTRGQEKRREYGCRGVRILRDLDDPHRVVNVFDWDREDLERFLRDPEVPAIMESAGLRGRPQFTFVEEAARLDA
jgi:quinol monooxygenase YgiN